MNDGVINTLAILLLFVALYLWDDWLMWRERRRWLDVYFGRHDAEAEREKWTPYYSGYGGESQPSIGVYFTVATARKHSRNRRRTVEYLRDHHPTERGREKAARWLADQDASHPMPPLMSGV